MTKLHRIFAKDRGITSRQCSSARLTPRKRSMRDRMSTREIVRWPDTQRWDFRSESSFVEVKIGSSLCVFHCRLREADWLNSMHKSCSKEWPYAAQREDSPRIRDSISIACNNFSVIVEERVGRTAMYGGLSCARGIANYVAIYRRSSSSSRPQSSPT